MAKTGKFAPQVNGKEHPATQSGLIDCFIDDSPTVHQVTIAGVAFRLRSLTAGEMRDVHAEAKVPIDGNVKGTTVERTDLIEMQILTVGFAMGIKKKYSDEGWDATRDLTFDNVRLLNEAILVELYVRHTRFFRPDLGDVGKLAAND